MSSSGRLSAKMINRGSSLDPRTIFIEYLMKSLNRDEDLWMRIAQYRSTWASLGKTYATVSVMRLNNNDDHLL
jgi:hypothetical protein